MILKTTAKIGEYINESIGIVISPDPNPKKPRIKPEKIMTIIINIKLAGKLFIRYSITSEYY